MPLKLNISNKGKSWKLEVESSVLEGKSIGDKIDGKLIKPELSGYQIQITGGTDFAGLPMSPKVEGIALKKVLLTKGWGMHKRPKGDKKRVSQPNGLRLRKTVRGKTISEKSMQINMNVIEEGKTSLAQIFPDQNKQPEPPQTEEKEVKREVAQPMETKEEQIAEEIAEEVKEEIEDKIPDSPETETEEEKEEAAEKIAEEVKEEMEEIAEEIAEDEKKE